MAGCYQCGEYNPHRAKYCMYCGHNLAVHSFKFADSDATFYLKKRREVQFKFAAAVTFASFCAVLTALVYIFEYYKDHYGRLIFIVLIILTITCGMGIAYYHSKHKRIAHFLKHVADEKKG
jgi:hypothetical protein